MASEVKVSAPKVNRQVTVNADLGTNTEEAVGLFGEEICWNKLRQKLVIDLQAYARNRLEATNEDGSPKYSDEEVQASIANWKPGQIIREKKSDVDKVADKFDKMSDDQQAALLDKLRERAKAKREAAKAEA